jgi:hypothetical protein
MMRYSSVSNVTGHGLEDRDSISGKGNDFLLTRHVPTGSWAHPASFPIDTVDLLFWG